MSAPLSRRSFLALSATTALGFPRLVAANTGSPPPVRTADGRPIIRDWLAEHRAYSDWHLTLVDPLYLVTAGYAPADLVSVTGAGIAGAGLFRRAMLADLRAMDQAARAAGIRLRVVSAYRSYWSQQAVFNAWVQRSGYDQAIRYSARAGHSEHQLGMTLDHSFVGGSDPWTYTDFALTRAGAWLKANAWRYGFVMSYPKGMERYTGYGYEPWHYRYYGRTLAAQQRASGVNPRYWLWRRN